MGLTKRNIIERAYTAGGLASYVFDLTAEELEAAKATLDSMLAMWSVKGARIAYNGGGALSDDAGLPGWSEEAVIANLALRVCGFAGKMPSPELKASARQSWNTVLAMVSQPPIARMDVGRLPAGSGNLWLGDIVLPEPPMEIETGPDGLIKL